MQKDQRNLYTVFIDHKKVFDNVLHSWLLEMCDIHHTIIIFLGTILRHWRTKLLLNTDSQFLCSDEVPIWRRFFQGDYLTLLSVDWNRFNHFMIQNTTSDGNSVANNNSLRQDQKQRHLKQPGGQVLALKLGWVGHLALQESSRWTEGSKLEEEPKEVSIDH